MQATVLVTAIAISIAAPAWANHHQQDDADEAPRAEVIERDADGNATRIRVDGFEVDVCRDGQKDNCINPREAGLDFGGVPIDYWPGRPASEIEGDLPTEQPAPEETGSEG